MQDRNHGSEHDHPHDDEHDDGDESPERHDCRWSKREARVRLVLQLLTAGLTAASSFGQLVTAVQHHF
jgi:hypothetical protein